MRQSVTTSLFLTERACFLAQRVRSVSVEIVPPPSIRRRNAENVRFKDSGSSQSWNQRSKTFLVFSGRGLRLIPVAIHPGDERLVRDDAVSRERNLRLVVELLQPTSLLVCLLVSALFFCFCPLHFCRFESVGTLYLAATSSELPSYKLQPKSHGRKPSLPGVYQLILQ